MCRPPGARYITVRPLEMDFLCVFTVVVCILIQNWGRINNFGIVLNRMTISWQKVFPFNKCSFAIWTSRRISLDLFAVLRVVLLSLIHISTLSRIHLLGHGVIELIRFIQLHMTRIDLYTRINVCLIISWCIISCFQRIFIVGKLCLSAIRSHVHSGSLAINSTLATRWHVSKAFLNVRNEW